MSRTQFEAEQELMAGFYEEKIEEKSAFFPCPTCNKTSSRQGHPCSRCIAYARDIEGTRKEIDLPYLMSLYRNQPTGRKK